MTNTFDVRIESLAYGGDAVGRLPDGRVVFVPYAIPGELVKLRLVEEKPHHATAALVEVLEPSPERVTPTVPAFFNLRWLPLPTPSVSSPGES